MPKVPKIEELNQHPEPFLFYYLLFTFYYLLLKQRLETDLENEHHFQSINEDRLLYT